jgi:AraC-like DNA-binding protein
VDDASGDSALAGPAFAYVDFAVAHGLPREQLLAAAQLRDELRADPDARCSPMSYVVLWQELVTRLPDVVVPVELVRALSPAALGVTAQVVLRADDVAHAATLIERFLRLSDTAMTMTWHERGDLVGLSIGHRPEVIAMRYPIELMLGVGFQLLAHAADRRVPLHEVTFAHPAGYPVAAYEALFGAPVRFEQPLSALWFPRTAAATPFRGRDPIARRYLEAQATQMLAAIPPTAAPVSPLVTQLRETILDELASSGADLGRVAKQLAMSTRTLQRRLEELDTTYQDLVDDVRSAAARSLLRDHARSIIEVAFELGYADLKGFYRAFKRWTGATPAEWRRRELAIAGRLPTSVTAR